jgi:hypothetical protein
MKPNAAINAKKNFFQFMIFAQEFCCAHLEAARFIAKWAGNVDPKNDEARMTNDKGNPNAQMTKLRR